MYIISEKTGGKWALTLRANNLKTVLYFDRYVYALEAVQLLQVHKNSFDKHNIFLKRNKTKERAWAK